MFNGIRVLTEAFRRLAKRTHKRDRGQTQKELTRFTYTKGPMYYLGEQIVRAMQKAGYPAKILYCYRSPEFQNELYQKGRTTVGVSPTPARPLGWTVTNADAWESPHNYCEAVDIIHETRGWDVSEEFWEALASCVRIVGDKYGVYLVHGHDWDGDGIPVHKDPDEKRRDSAHIELGSWRVVKRWHQASMTTEDRERPLNDDELWLRFEEILPQVARTLINDWGRCRRVLKDVTPEIIGTGLPKKG